MNRAEDEPAMPHEGLCRRNSDAAGPAGARHDGAERPRRIDHLVTFLREETALRFADHVIAKNYAVREALVSEGQWLVRFFRYDHLCDIEAVTLDLLRDVRDFGGSYEGWGCDTAPAADGRSPASA
jgi:hypothetical protein